MPENNFDYLAIRAREYCFIHETLRPALTFPPHVEEQFFVREGHKVTSLKELILICEKALGNGDEEVVCAALKLLQPIITKLPRDCLDLVPSLIKAGDDECPNVQQYAIEALACFGRVAPFEAVETVVKSLRHSVLEVQVAAIKALPSFGPDLGGMGVTVLGSIVGNEVNKLEKLEACGALGQLGSEAKSTVEALVHAAIHDPDAQINLEAAMALVAIDPAGELVPSYCEDPDQQVCLIRLLRKLGESGRGLRNRIEACRPTDRTYRNLEEIADALETYKEKVSDKLKQLKITKANGRYTFTASQWAKIKSEIRNRR